MDTWKTTSPHMSVLWERDLMTASRGWERLREKVQITCEVERLSDQWNQPLLYAGLALAETWPTLREGFGESSSSFTRWWRFMRKTSGVWLVMLEVDLLPWQRKSKRCYDPMRALEALKAWAAEKESRSEQMKLPFFNGRL